MLDRLQPKRGSRPARRRVGRGVGSGLAKTSGRGSKGAGARTGARSRPHREGGAMPLAMRLPKFGFHNKWRTETQVVNVGVLGRFEAGSQVDAARLATAGLVPSAHRPVKLLAHGMLDRALVIRVDRASEAARQKVEAAGGQLVLPAPRPRPRRLVRRSGGPK
jgi:large subunit ribosomal protein L15